MQGTVAWFSSGKGIGFISPAGGGQDVFCHFSEIEGKGFKTLERGSRVEFEIGTSPKNNKPMATKIRQLEVSNGSNSTTAR